MWIVNGGKQSCKCRVVHCAWYYIVTCRLTRRRACLQSKTVLRVSTTKTEGVREKLRGDQMWGITRLPSLRNKEAINGDQVWGTTRLPSLRNNEVINGDQVWWTTRLPSLMNNEAINGDQLWGTTRRPSAAVRANVVACYMTTPSVRRCFPTFSSPSPKPFTKWTSPMTAWDMITALLRYINILTRKSGYRWQPARWLLDSCGSCQYLVLAKEYLRCRT